MTKEDLAFFEDAKRYVGFGPADGEALRRLLEVARPMLPPIIDHFYECVQGHPGAMESIRGGAEQVERLKVTLNEWLVSGLEGPHEEAYLARRARIGRRHVVIGLAQHYMFTAINVMRRDLRAVIEQVYADDRERRRVTGDAVDRLLDLELAIMLHTYREDSDQRLNRQSRLAAIGQVAAGIAHELRNPLGVIETSVYLMRRRVADDERVVRHLDKVTAQVRVAGGIITDLLEMARDRPPLRTPTPVSELLAQAMEVVRLPGTLTLSAQLSDDPPLDVEPRLVVRALVNLIGNAIASASAAGHTGRVEVRVLPPTPDGLVGVSVLDEGGGFDPMMLPRVFEPLVTNRVAGVGLGLALVQRICARHGGRAVAANREEGGAVVTLFLPGVPAGAARAPAEV